MLMELPVVRTLLLFQVELLLRSWRLQTSPNYY
jgi:hypothetical protein